MGVLIIDHRHTVDPTGTRDGILQEFDTVACVHCQAVIRKVITGPCRTRLDSPGECDHCRRPVCHSCGAKLQIDEACPGEMRAVIRRAWEQTNPSQALFFPLRR